MTTDHTIRLAISTPASKKSDLESQVADITGNPADTDGFFSVRESQDASPEATHYGANVQLTPTQADEVKSLVDGTPGAQWTKLEDEIGTDDHQRHAHFPDHLDKVGRKRIVPEGP